MEHVFDGNPESKNRQFHSSCWLEKGGWHRGWRMNTVEQCHRRTSHQKSPEVEGSKGPKKSGRWASQYLTVFQWQIFPTFYISLHYNDYKFKYKYDKYFYISLDYLSSHNGHLPPLFPPPPALISVALRPDLSIISTLCIFHHIF